MEVEDKDANLLKESHLENGNSTDNHITELSGGTLDCSVKASKNSICNGDVRKNESSEVLENGVLNNDTNSNSASVDTVQEVMSSTVNSECKDENGVDEDEDMVQEDDRASGDINEDLDKTSDHEIDGNSANENSCEEIDKGEISDQNVSDVENQSNKDQTEDTSEEKSESEREKGDDDKEFGDEAVNVVEKNDSEKENNDTKEVADVKDDRLPERKDSCNDDVEIIGESKVIQIDSPAISNISPQNVVLMAPGMSRNFSPSPALLSSPNSFSPTNLVVSNMSPGYMMNGRGSLPSYSLLQGAGTSAPPKPKSSLDQIELIRWEIQNRLNTRPKYFKPNPSAELGPLAKFLFDIGSNLIKEAVYHELVKIQSRKNDDNALSEKEKEDLEKLKDIEKDLHATIGHLKFKMKKRCKACNFQTESGNVIYHHKQYPHEDSKNLHCAHCSFVTKQPMTFKFHLESEHGVQPRLHDKKAFFECDLCPYENNQELKLNAHKARCAKQFRPLFNLHPSCLSGAEINLCLENIFYKPVVPKNLKILQQKHAQQQAALAEARRQQAEVQALAAQKNAAAMVAKRHRQVVNIPTPQRQTPTNQRQFQRTQGPTMPVVRYNTRPAPPSVRPTVANMLKDKHTKPSPQFTQAQHSNAPGGFEVCEICGGYVKDRKALRIHFFYAHRIDLPFNLFDRNQPPLYCATCYVRFWTAQGLRKHIDIHVQEKKIPDGFMGEGVHGKCISCGQLVGNIVVHMRVVHNREIHHYINALMCMFCGASFNSRQNVERHITDVHGTIDIATGAVKIKPKLKSSPQQNRPSSSNPKKGGSGKDSLVKGSVCVLCNLNFGRNVDLTRHCMRMHHTCMKCGMVVIDKASLLKHTCLSSPSGTRDCTMCSETGFHPAYYVKHLRDKHLRKFSIVVARVSPNVIEKWIKRPYPFKTPADDPVEISDSEDETPDDQTPSPSSAMNSQNDTDGQGPKKKARIGPASKIGRTPLSEEERQSGLVSPTMTAPSNKRKMSIINTPGRNSKRRK